MTKTTLKSPYWEGLRNGLPFVVVVGPFALLFGVVASEAGMALAHVMGFTVMVIAGAAQFAALQMMVENASLGMVLLAALAVNLRMAMYSAALVPYLGSAPLWQRALISYMNFDQTYAASVAKYETSPDWNVTQRAQFFFGLSTPIVPVWIVFTLVGALIGKAIPPEWALDFAVPITFLGLVGPALKTPAHIAAAVVSVVVALALIDLPSGAGLLIAALSAMITGAVVETRMGRAVL
ncbi:AzlC family ABC transporter permease [Octadecabacter sp. R77987]|uniref:AzlC family ABC transporter permease n=1 Tax=Octadecabacter sp. R77987 TaxID=3093874 RepID=UPI00366BD28C